MLFASGCFDNIPFYDLASVDPASPTESFQIGAPYAERHNCRCALIDGYFEGEEDRPVIAVTASYGGETRLYDVNARQTVLTLPVDGQFSLETISSVSSRRDSSVRLLSGKTLFDPRSGDELLEITAAPSSWMVYRAKHLTGTNLVLLSGFDANEPDGSRGCIASFDIQRSGKLVRKFTGHAKIVYGLCRGVADASSRRRLFASCSYEGIAKVWDVRSAKCSLTIPLPESDPGYSCVYASDANQLLVGTTGQVEIFDLRNSSMPSGRIRVSQNRACRVQALVRVYDLPFYVAGYGDIHREGGMGLFRVGGEEEEGGEEGPSRGSSEVLERMAFLIRESDGPSGVYGIGCLREITEDMLARFLV